MGIYERDYNRDNYSGGTSGPRICLPSLTPVVKWLLIINTVIYMISAPITWLDNFLLNWCSVITAMPESIQLWRIITFQFVHADIGHLFFNMLCLYFFGTMLENAWNSKRFLIFYLICGAMGGIVYPILCAVGFPGVNPGILIGASGALFGIVIACAITFPSSKVFVLGVIPVPMPVLAAIMVLVSIYTLVDSINVGGELTHLSGAATGAILVLWQPWLQKRRAKMNDGRWEKKIVEERELYVSVDQILDKVHKSGMKSLTRKEKKILREATEKEQGK